MRRLIATTAAAAALAALAAGCSSGSVSSGSGAGGSGSTTAPSSAPATGSPAPATGGAAALTTAHSADGTIVVDGSGRALYLFRADTGPVSSCTGACAVAWPPDTTTGTPSATGLTAARVGESARADKSTQVTYFGHPLYRFAHDSAPGDVNGEGVTAFGGSWYLVGPDGNAITSPSSAPSTAPSPAPSTSGGGYGSGY